MPATCTSAAIYWADAVCASPLRSAGTGGDSDQVLRHRDGTPFLQGASLTGALRDWLEANGYADSAAVLFGSQQRGGQMIVSDAVFEHAEQYIRPRLAMDSATGSAMQGGKFDMAHLGRGTAFSFSLTWLHTEEREREYNAIRAMLSALHGGQILLGAQKSSGFGRVTLTVRERRLYMQNDPACGNEAAYLAAREKDRDAWLAWDGSRASFPEEGSVPLTLSDVPPRGDTLFTVSGSCGGLLVKASASRYETLDAESGEQGQITVNIEEGGMPVLPGSSVKGAVRARAAAIAKFLRLPDTFIEERMFGRGGRGKEDAGIPGRVRFSDVLLSGSPEDRRKISRIRIDCFTGGVIRQGLFREEPVRAGALTLRITAPEDDKARGLLLYALRDLGLGLYTLGSGQAVGQGYIAVDSIRAEAADGRTASIEFREEEGLRRAARVIDPDELFGEWLMALEVEE